MKKGLCAVLLQCHSRSVHIRHVLFVHLLLFASCLSLPRSLSLLPCYEAIHHKILDSEEIILYIAGQHCHLEEKPNSPPHVCSQ